MGAGPGDRASPPRPREAAPVGAHALTRAPSTRGDGSGTVGISTSPSPSPSRSRRRRPSEPARERLSALVELRVNIRQLARRYALRRRRRRASQVSPGQRVGAANRPEPRNHRRLRQPRRLPAQKPVAHVAHGPQVRFGLGSRRRRRSRRGKGRRRFGRRRGNFLSRRRHPRGETLDADVVVKHGTRTTCRGPSSRRRRSRRYPPRRPRSSRRS